MSENIFKVIRPGINTTFQDKGRSNLYHLGIPFSGAMDNRNYLLANKLVGNDLNNPVLNDTSPVITRLIFSPEYFKRGPWNANSKTGLFK